MSEHLATIRWDLPSDAVFLKGRYSREHTWTFDGGFTMQASPAPNVVPEPFSNPAHVDPEEAFVASVASCHMLTFLHVASKAGFEVRSYEDQAVGTMAKNENGVPWVSAIALRPQITWGEQAPDVEELERLHHQAHAYCFIANSVKTEVRVESSGQ